jgi:hypothetical protein
MIHLTVIKRHYQMLPQISTTNNGVNLNVSNGSVNVNSGVPVGDYVLLSDMWNRLLIVIPLQ